MCSAFVLEPCTVPARLQEHSLKLETWAARERAEISASGLCRLAWGDGSPPTVVRITAIIKLNPVTVNSHKSKDFERPVCKLIFPFIARNNIYRNFDIKVSGLTMETKYPRILEVRVSGV